MARLVVTLPRGLGREEQHGFARRAREAGADLLELRSDLHGERDVEPAALAGELPLLAAERGRPLPSTWLATASERDRALGSPPDGRALISWHAERPLEPREALAAWEARAPDAAAVKHVEPLGSPAQALRLLETRRLLAERFGAGVTVLAVGALALPFRCLLARENALDYVALDATALAAPGQRLLAAAVRERKAKASSPLRRGILGTAIAQSRSPERHVQPFDRIDLPADADLGPLLEALHPFYAGFAVTSPFKKAAAQIAGSSRPAVNTLRRTEGGWEGLNTDVDGARAVLRSLGARSLTALGDGGVTAALREACAAEGVALSVLRRQALSDRSLSGTLVWTWPPQLPPPPRLRFDGARVAVVTYGARAQQVSDAIRARGGEPVVVGEQWFSAQADGQARLWEVAP